MFQNAVKVENRLPVTMKEEIVEPEEGEIIDDYELISSDEEFSVRKRIRELEEENAEIEQIAVISRSYDIDRAARIPSDASSISSTEFKTPKKRKRHKNKEHKKKVCHHHHHTSGHHRHHTCSSHVDKKYSRSRKTRCKRKEKLLKKRHTKSFPKDLRDNLILGSPDSLNTSISSLSFTDSDGSCRYMSEDERDDNYYYRRSEVRNTLRLAIARSRKNSTRQSGHNVDLKERLLRKDLKFTGNQFKDIEDEEDDVVICEPAVEIQYVPDDSSESMEENELRLLALKSAVLKKHMDRKRRNAEVAYSPTDLDDLMSSCVVEPDYKLVDLEVVDLDEEDSQNISPIASPQFAILDCLDDSSQMINCKPVDMDLVNSDSEGTPAAPNNFSTETPNTIPYPPYPPNDLGSTYPYGLYIPEFNTNSLNPPPPGVDDYEDIKQVKTINYKQNHDTDAQDMDVENDDFVPIETFPTTCSKESLKTQELKMNGELTLSLNSNPVDEETQEEEEQALRALLLSKFSSPKIQKKIAKPLHSTLEVEKENVLDDPPNIDSKPTEAILKEAVKRLKIVGMCKENIRQDNTLTWEQPLIFDQQKDICYNKSPAMWDHPNHLQDSTYDVPEPHIDTDADHNLNNLPNLKTLECLKKRVKELKKNKDLNLNDEGSHQNLTTAANHIIKHDCSDVTNMNMNSNLEFKIKTREVQNIEQKHLNLQTNLLIATNTKLEKPEMSTCREQSSNSAPILDEDTRRRLQKLKDEILIATQNKYIEPLAEVDEQSHLTIKEELETLQDYPFNSEEIQPAFLAETIDDSCKHKETTGQADHRITQAKELMKEAGNVTNISKTKPLKSNASKEAIDVSLNKTALKENNLNKQNKNKLKLKSDIVVSFKNTLESKKVVRTVCETAVSLKSKQITTSSTKTLKPVASTVATVTPIQGDLVKPIPTYPLVKTTKIVKPNKVINKNVNLKRKIVLEKSKPSPENPPKKIAIRETAEIPAPLKITAKPIDNQRLIVSMDQVRHLCTVAPFVISLQQTTNESSDEEFQDCDLMYRPSYEYNDIKSPLSLNLETPCVTPARLNSPVDVPRENAENLTKLKRSPITFPNETSVPTSTIADNTVNVVKTPVAVRHLPAAAQDEYRKLVNRMKLLENQRLKREILNAPNDPPLAIQENNANSASTPSLKPTLVKQVLLKNTNNKISSASSLPAKKTTAALCPDPTAKPHKTNNVLRAYESLYAKIGAGIMNNLDKSLNLVEEAKKAKINKLKLAGRLKKLKEEMEVLQTLYKAEEQTISRIYPSICSTNEVITSLKQKRSKVFKAALNLGKSLKGEDYRLNNELKQNITIKSKKLASDIKMVNSLKAEDIDKLLLEEHVPNGMDTKHPVDIKNCQECSMNIEIVPAESCENETDNIENINQINLKTNQSVNNDPKDQSNVSTNIICDKLHDDKQNRNESVSPRSEEDSTTNSVDEHNRIENITSRTEEDNARNSDESKEGQSFEDSMPKSDSPYVEATNSANGVTQQFQKSPLASNHCADADAAKCLENGAIANKEDENEDQQMDLEDNYEAEDCDSKSLLSYTSPLDHLRNINGIVDPNGVVCPYDLMGNCEDTTCKYVHISQKDTDLADNLAA